MSVTININNNREYVDANCPELIITDQEYIDWLRERGDPVYPHSGKQYPFEMNIANGNFAALWASLGLEADCCGEIAASVLLKHLNLFSAKRLTCNGYNEGNFYEGGRSTEQVTRYYWSLSQIANEAAKRGENVTWG